MNKVPFNDETPAVGRIDFGPDPGESRIGLAILGLVTEFEGALGRLREQLAAEYGHEPEVEQPALRGERQEAIAQLPGLFSTLGMPAGEISREASYDEANTYTVLNSLTKNGLLEVVPDSTPRRWRLALEHRRNKILRASTMVGRGEWTTYGDLAVAAAGNKLAARAVGRMAAKHPAFANPHRVINAGGVIPPGWQATWGGPEECRRRLEEEEVRFLPDGTAAPRQRITWEVIEERLGAAQEVEDLDEAA
jgi:alkylated DNA nucleotide flippase Atl1